MRFRLDANRATRRVKAPLFSHLSRILSIKQNSNTTQLLSIEFFSLFMAAHRDVQIFKITCYIFDDLQLDESIHQWVDICY
jgi:hypothetical protein